MNPSSDIQNQIDSWLETWASHCGAPRSVFVGQFRTLLDHIFDDICLRAKSKIYHTGQLEGAHHAAIEEVWKEIRTVVANYKPPC